MLTLSAGQWQAMREHEANSFADAVAGDYLKEHPEMADQPGTLEICMRMRAAHAYALGLGFTSSPHLVAFMHLAAVLPAFYEQPQVDKVLRKPGRPPEQRFSDYEAVLVWKIRKDAEWQQ